MNHISACLRIPLSTRPSPNRLESAARARTFAEHALGLLSESAHFYGRAYAHVEMGRALAHLGDEFSAGTSFFEAANEARIGGREELFGRALDFGISYTFDRSGPYSEGLARALGVSFAEDDTMSARLFVLWRRLAMLVPKQELIHLLGLHLNVLFNYVPPPFHSALANSSAAAMIEMARSNQMPPWRLLQAAIPVAAALSRAGSRFVFSELAQAICSADNSVYSRNEDDGTQMWTLSMNLGKPVIISIASMDSTLESQVACLALASFLKAFEEDIASELPIQNPATNEVTIHVASFGKMPPDIQEMMDAHGVQEMIANGGCSVTRPTDFSSSMPTAVVIASDFLSHISMGVPPGGAFQMLFGATTVELVYQMLRGEVDLEAIRPKLVGIVRKTL